MNDIIVYSEVYEILNILGKKYIDKLPKDLYNLIDESRDKNIVVKIDGNNSIKNQNISNEAIEFICLLNLKYWSTAKEAEELIKIYNANEEKWRKEVNNIFKQEEKKEIKQQNNSLIVKNKDSLFKIIMEKIKNLFRIIKKD